MNNLVWSVTAQRDLRQILQYYGQFGEDVPVKLIAAVDRAANLLLDNPRMGPAVADSDTRAWLARGTPFVLLYRCSQTTVRILKVKHAATDWKPAA